MITTVLFILIGIKFNMLHGWYLGLIITKIILDIFKFGLDCIKVGRGE